MATTAVAARTPPGSGRTCDAAGAGAIARTCEPSKIRTPRREQPLAQPEGEPRGMDVRPVRAVHAAAEHRGVAARAGLLGRQRDHRARRRRPPPSAPSCAGARRDDQLAAAAVPGVDALRLAPRADRVHRVARRRAHSSRAGRAVVGRAVSAARQPQRARRSRRCARSVRARSASASSTTTRASGSRLQQLPRRPHAGVAAADDHDVRACARRPAAAAPAGCPPPRSSTRARRAASAEVAATARDGARSTSRSPRGTSPPTGSPGKLGGRPASPSRIARLRGGQVQQRVAALEAGDERARRSTSPASATARSVSSRKPGTVTDMRPSGSVADASWPAPISIRSGAKRARSRRHDALERERSSRRRPCRPAAGR